MVLGSAAAADGGYARSFVPTRNEAASPFRYEIHLEDLLRLTLDADEHDEVFWAIVHSHRTRRPDRRPPTSGWPSIPTRSTSSSPSPTPAVTPRRPTRRPATRRTRPRPFAHGASSTARSSRSRSRLPNDGRPRPRAPSWGDRPFAPISSKARRSSSASARSRWRRRSDGMRAARARRLAAAGRATGAAIASLILALALLGAAVARMESRTEPGGHLVTMLRGIRLAFLALACASVAIGWALGSGLPFVIALDHRRHRRDRDDVPSDHHPSGALSSPSPPRDAHGGLRSVRLARSGLPPCDAHGGLRSVRLARSGLRRVMRMVD